MKWGRLLASIANWAVAGGLAAIIPDRYKPIAVGVAALIQSLLPSVVYPPLSPPVKARRP